MFHVSGKKAFSVAPIAIIIAVVLLIFYLYFGGAAYSTINEELPRETCRQSVVLHASTKTTITDSPFPINCDTQFIDITEKGIFKNTDQVITSESEMTQDTVNRAIANEMYDCWYQFLQGNQEVFYRSWSIKINDDWTTECMICSEISISQEAADKIGKRNSGDFIQWMKDTTIQQYTSGSGTSDMNYYDYLGRASPTPMTYEELVRAIDSKEKELNIPFLSLSLSVFNPVQFVPVPYPGDYAVVFKSLTPLRLTVGVEYLAAVHLIRKQDVGKLSCKNLY
ncbi:MAG: hypothetical protein V1702_05825 [Candidatus Woesearchaeota archaeon]